MVNNLFTSNYKVSLENLYVLKGVLLNVCSIDHIPELDYMEWALGIICFVIRCIAISKKICPK